MCFDVEKPIAVIFLNLTLFRCWGFSRWFKKNLLLREILNNPIRSLLGEPKYLVLHCLTPLVRFGIVEMNNNENITTESFVACGIDFQNIS